MWKYNFEAETWRILELLTHSIYSNKEIFLRELVSNASDAIDKARLKSLTDTTFLWDDVDLKIWVESDKNKWIITIRDNGIWMTKEELVNNLWTIAKSWTKEFLEKLEKAKEQWEHNLIGQFWVWFYSSFMIADKVEVESKSALDKKAHKWVSDWKSSYDIEESDKQDRGTIITLFVNEANKELLEEWKLKELIKKYSNYVGVPIMMKAYDPRSEEEKKKEPKEMDFEQVNETKPIWKKDKKDIKKEEYKDFYQTLTYDWSDPLFTIHNNVEWMVSYKSILYSPKDVNMYKNLADPNLEYGPRLYVQNVMILENAKELMPIWLRFISWVVETNDLPLNISREMLQENPSLDKIKKWLTKKVLWELWKILKDKREDYKVFWANYWKVLKEWIHYEYELKEDIAEIALFNSLLENSLITLDEYLEKAPEKESPHPTPLPEGEGIAQEEEKQKTIYYIIAKSENEAKASPYISQFKDKWVDVLIFTDAIDSFITHSLSNYKWAKLVSITSDEIELEKTDENTKKEKEKREADLKPLFDLMKKTIWDEKIENVVLNDKLGKSLWALRTPKNWVDPQLEKMMKAMWQQVPVQKRILELNPKNKLVDLMKKEFEKDIKSKRLEDAIKYAYSQAILLEWWELENIWEFIELTNKFASESMKD